MRNFITLALRACHGDHIPALLDRNFSHWLGFFSRFITSPLGYVTAIMRSTWPCKSAREIGRDIAPRQKSAKWGAKSRWCQAAPFGTIIALREKSWISAAPKRAPDRVVNLIPPAGDDSNSGVCFSQTSSRLWRPGDSHGRRNERMKTSWWFVSLHLSSAESSQLILQQHHRPQLAG